MQTNDVFTVDQSAIDELKLEGVTAGQQYRITQLNSVEARGSRIVGGQPQKGRPRRFPVALVARLMGEALPAATDTATAVATPAPVADAPTDEERAKASETVSRALDGAASTNSDW